MNTESAEKFDSWAVVELFGHQQIAGRVSEASIGGAAFIRVDVPEQPGRKAVQQWDRDQPAIPAYTRYFGGGAIYALNPCSEEAAKRVATNLRARAPIPFDVPTPPLLSAPSRDGHEDYEEDMK